VNVFEIGVGTQPATTRGKRIVRAVVFSLIAALPLNAVDAALSISVSPPILDLAQPPGTEKVLMLTVRNSGDMAVLITPMIMDLKLGETGAAVPVERGTGTRSCADWIAMDTSVFELAPDERVEREVSFNVPRGASGGAYCVLLFEAEPVRGGGRDSHLSIATRTGTIVMETASRRSLRLGELTDPKVSRNGDAVGLTAYFRNTGDIHVTVRPSCVIKDSNGRIIDRIKMDVGTGTVLPEGLRRISGTWDNRRKMIPARYVAEISVDYRGPRRAKTSVDFTIE
jgi:hypothetical protein